MSKGKQRKLPVASPVRTVKLDPLHRLRIALECGGPLSDEMRAELVKIVVKRIDATRRGKPGDDAVFRMAYLVDCLVDWGMTQKAAVIEALGEGATVAAVAAASRNYRRLKRAGSLDDPQLIFTKLPPATQESGQK